MSINSIEVVNGEMLAGMDKAKGTRGNIQEVTGGNIVAPPVEAPTLSEIGITKRQSSDWQEAERRAGEKLAEMPKAKGTAGQGRPSLGGNIVLPPKEEAPTLTEIGITKQQSADWQEVELSQVKKAILLEIGKSRMVEGGEAKKEGLSTIDRPSHSTREEIATELGWSTGKVAMADKVWKEAVSVPNAAPVKCWQKCRRRRVGSQKRTGATMLPVLLKHPPYPK